MRDHSIGLALRAAKGLRVSVGINDAIFRNERYDSWPRSFFLYDALDEVDKAAMYMVQVGEFVLEPGTGEDDGSSTARACAEMVSEDLHFRGRGFGRTIRAPRDVRGS